jgi:hypothetical protein
MKKFMYLFIGVDTSRLAPEHAQAQMQRWAAWMQQLGKAGHFQAGERFEPLAATVAGKDKGVTDGPFAEAKDVVGGYLVVAAEDLAQATELAKGCPIFESGGRVEVRPIVEARP